MTQSSRAIMLNIIYALPLLIWFSNQLQFIDWTTNNLQALFQQTLFSIIILQCSTLLVLFINHPEGNWHDDLLAIIHILIFPLPFMALFYLSGSSSLSLLVKSFALISLTAIIIFFIQQLVRLLVNKNNIVQPFFTFIIILLAISIWNFRQTGWDWLTL